MVNGVKAFLIFLWLVNGHGCVFSSSTPHHTTPLPLPFPSLAPHPPPALSATHPPPPGYLCCNSCRTPSRLLVPCFFLLFKMSVNLILSPTLELSITTIFATSPRFLCGDDCYAGRKLAFSMPRVSFSLSLSLSALGHAGTVLLQRCRAHEKKNQKENVRQSHLVTHLIANNTVCVAEQCWWGHRLFQSKHSFLFRGQVREGQPPLPSPSPKTGGSKKKGGTKSTNSK